MHKLGAMIIFFILLIGFFNIFKTVEISKADSGNVLYVNGNGVSNYSSIQDAINDSKDNDTIYINNGTYKENIVINKSINLIGFDRTSVFINCSGNLYALLIKAPWVNISGFTIENSDVGIFVSGSGYFFNSFVDNILIANEEGVRLVNTSNNRITNNIIQNQSSAGIVLYDSINNSITGNSFMDNEKAISLSRWSDKNIISGNDLNDNHFGICLDFSFNNLISQNWISNGGFGIYLTNSNSNNITDNNIEYNDVYGIYLSNSDDNLVSPNNFLKNYQDVKIETKLPTVSTPGFEIFFFIFALLLILFVKKRYSN